MPDVPDKHHKAARRRGLLLDLLYNFPQQAFLLLLFGVLVIAGAVASLVFKIDAPMFVQILYVVGAGCGIRMGADAVKYLKQDIQGSREPTSEK